MVPIHTLLKNCTEKNISSGLVKKAKKLTKLLAENRAEQENRFATTHAMEDAEAVKRLAEKRVPEPTQEAEESMATFIAQELQLRDTHMRTLKETVATLKKKVKNAKYGRDESSACLQHL